MIPTIGFMVCILLVAKGFEFVQRVLLAPRDQQGMLARMIAVLMFLLCVGGAMVLGMDLFVAATRETGGVPRLR